jgi:protein-S-isoprenylcysteine O-methyltransferase Ste14
VLTFVAVAVYGAVHSLLASFWSKGLARRAAGPAADRFYRLGFNVLGALTFLPVLAVTASWPGTILYRIGWPWTVLTSMGQLAAVVLLLLGLLQADVWHFLGVRQLLQPADQQPSRLVVTGTYRWVRHPLYTAGLLFIWLTPIMTTSVLALNLGLSLYIYIGSIFEERRLLAEFGQAYQDYRAQVPRLIPYPRRLLSSSSWVN